jgi:hypothetical protein
VTKVTARLLAKSVELPGGLVHPGERVFVNADGYHGRAGEFRGQMADGRLAVKINLSKYSQTILFLRKGEVSKGAQHERCIAERGV